MPRGKSTANKEVKMPIYEYECQKCGKIYEIFHKMNDETERFCKGYSKGSKDSPKGKKCKGKLEKIISLTGKPKINGYAYANDYTTPSTSRK